MEKNSWFSSTIKHWEVIQLSQFNQMMDATVQSYMALIIADVQPTAIGTNGTGKHLPPKYECPTAIGTNGTGKHLPPKYECPTAKRNKRNWRKSTTKV